MLLTRTGINNISYDHWTNVNINIKNTLMMTM
jgi:hypothetical protein